MKRNAPLIMSLVVIGLSIFSHPSAFAVETRQPPLEMSLSGDLVCPLGSVSAQNIALSGAASGSLIARIAPWVGVGVSGSQGFEGTGDASRVNRVRAVHTTQVSRVTADVEFGHWFEGHNMWINGIAKPYLLLGGGYYQVNSTVSQIDPPNLSYPNGGNYGGYSFGLGLAIQITPHIAFGAEYRYHIISVSHAPDKRYLTVSLPLIYLF